MKITFDWLKDHLDTNLKEEKLLEQLTNIGLEVENVENLSEGIDLFKIAKIIKTEKHPNADRLKVCDVNVGGKELKKVVCASFLCDHFIHLFYTTYVYSNNMY